MNRQSMGTTTSNVRCCAAIRTILLLSASALLSIAADAGQPPDNVASDPAGDTAMGTNALGSLTSGYQNTASGDGALESNQGGYKNTASGYAALQSNTSGSDNAAFGSGALVLNQGGSDDAAFGMDALYHNVSGIDNAALGSHALYTNYGGHQNTASGYFALYTNGDGDGNTATGFAALKANETGAYNTAVGTEALQSTTEGNYNIGIGTFAGTELKSGSYNIYIGNECEASDAGTIRIGTAKQQTQALIAGISTSQITGAAVYVTSAGKLGVLASSERYKTAINSMGMDTEGLSQLRPVTFHLKNDPTGPIQYGLIAEEVDKIYPELVIRDDAGRIQGVRYDELAPMLLNEVQKQKETVATQKASIDTLNLALVAVNARAHAEESELAQLADLKRQMAQMAAESQAMQAELVSLQGKEHQVAMR